MRGFPRMKLDFGFVFPIKLKARLRYSEAITLTTGAAGIAAVNQFRLNGLYDPNLTGTGHQPLGYDQITPLYNKYKVNACRLIVFWTTPGATSDLVTFVHCMPTSATPTLSGQNSGYVLEIPGVQASLLSSSGVRKSFFEGNIHLPRLLGRSKAEFEADSNFYSLTNTVPGIVPLVEVGIVSPAGVGSEACICQITMEFDCEFSDRIDPGQS